jgi:hypothetical protein
MAEVFVYRLIQPSVLTARATVIRAHLIANAGPQVEEVDFQISPVSGCFKWFASTSRVAATLPPKSAEEARRAAARFFVAVNSTAAEYRARNRIELIEYPNPFPLPALRHVATREFRSEAAVSQRSVPVPGQGEITFWRSFWMLFLRFEAFPPINRALTRLVPVYGATVEAVIGPGGRIESIVSTVRPFSGIGRTPTFPPPEDHHIGDKTGSPSLVYVADGADEPMTFYAPFYFTAEAVHERSHGTMLRPACDYSLIVDMIAFLDGEGIRIVPVVMDSTGEMIFAEPQAFTFSWFYGRFEETVYGEVTRSTAPELYIKAMGIFHIELTVTHRATGAVRSTYRQIPLGDSASAIESTIERVS